MSRCGGRPATMVKNRPKTLDLSVFAAMRCRTVLKLLQKKFQAASELVIEEK